MTPAEPTKRCPFCAEEILVAAVKCKHCGTDLTQAVAVRRTTAIKTWFNLAVFTALASWAAYSWWSYREHARTAEITENAKNYEADERYDRAVDALDRFRPASLSDAARLVGEDPLTCDRDPDTEGGICRWHFHGKWIRVYADGTKKGSRVLRIAHD